MLRAQFRKLACWLSIAGVKFVPIDQMPEMEENNSRFQGKTI